MTPVVDVSLCPICLSSFGETILSPLRPGGPSPSPYMSTSPRLRKNFISQPVVINRFREENVTTALSLRSPLRTFGWKLSEHAIFPILVAWMLKLASKKPTVREDLFRNKTKGQEKRRGTNRFIRFFAYMSLSELLPYTSHELRWDRGI